MIEQKRVLRRDELCIHVCAPKSIKMCAACVVDKSDSERESLVCVCVERAFSK